MFISRCYCTIVTRVYELAQLLSSIQSAIISCVGSSIYVFLSVDAIVQYYTHKGIRAGSAPLSLNSVINKSCWVTYLCLFIYGCYCTTDTRVYELAQLLSSIHSVINKSCRVSFLCLCISGCYCTTVTRL
jgi:hypothetical protein